MHLKNGIRKETKLARERAKNRQTSDVEHGGLTFIEQLTALCAVDCDAYEVPFFYRADDDEKKIEFAKGSCGMWSCESCGAKNAKKWIARIIDGCNKLSVENWHFATITAHQKWRGSSGSLLNIRNNWHKLRKRMARVSTSQHEDLFYARVWEGHKDASFHMHLVTNAQINTRWLKDNSAQCGLGYQAKIDEVVNAGQVAGYVSKYMLKAMPNATHYPKGARRIEVSRNWVAWHEKTSDWKLVHSFEAAKFMASRYEKEEEWSVHDLALRNEETRRVRMFEELQKDKKS